MFQPVCTQLLDAVVREGFRRSKILSIIAPTGYGKTVLMSELFSRWHQAGETCFWIGLADRNMGLARVVAAMEGVIHVHEDDTLSSQPFLPGDEPIESRIEVLLETLSQLSTTTTIFIDNLNCCNDETLGNFLDALIFRTPASIRFVWSSSVDIPFNLARAKLNGLIRQAGFSELSLNEAEVRELLGADIAHSIGAQGVSALLQQTEGWPAAIRMAQIILADSPQPLTTLNAFSGSDEDIAHLLNRQVLQGFPKELREFVLLLAQLRTFCLDLARQATGSKEAGHHLDFLFQRNVFVIPLDRNRKWYRLHGLFRAYLLSEAERSLSPERRRDVLRRAAEWCEKSGDWRDAVDYALAAEAYPFASRLVEKMATSSVRERGDIRQYIQWVERLQAENAQLGWETQFWFVWALLFNRRYDYGRQQHEKLVERLLQKSETDLTAPKDLPPRLDHLRVYLDLCTDHLIETYHGAERWLAEEHTDNAFSVASINLIKVVCLAHLFKFPQARQNMRIAEGMQRQFGGDYGIGWTSAINAVLSIYEGDYVHAHKELTAGLSLTRDALGDDAGLSGTMALVGAKCAVEMGLNDEAHSLLSLGLRTALSHGLVDTTAFGFEAAVKLWSGVDDEIISITELREIANTYPPRLSLMLSCYLVRRLLRLGQLQDAITEAKSIGLGPESGVINGLGSQALTIPCYRDLYAATAIELNLAIGKIKQAESQIAHEFRLARAEGRTARQVELMLGKATIAMYMDKLAIATKEIIFAIIVAAKRRIVRPFHDYAQTMTNIVNDTTASSWAFTGIDEGEFFAEICRSLQINSHLKQEKAAVWNAEAGQSVTPTKREIELLSLIDMGLTNQEMANCTNVSITTIKWHLSNLYRKLGVSNRSASLARARGLKLLSK